MLVWWPNRRIFCLTSKISNVCLTDKHCLTNIFNFACHASMLVRLVTTTNIAWEAHLCFSCLCSAQTNLRTLCMTSKISNVCQTMLVRLSGALLFALRCLSNFVIDSLLSYLSMKIFWHKVDCSPISYLA